MQLHLTPLHAVVQMRPELTHIDAADAQRRQDEAAARDGPDDGAAQAVKPISVLYRKVDSDRVADIKRSSFAHLQDKLEREKWSQLKILPRRSLEAQDTFERLISESCEPVPFEYNLPQLMEICNPPVPDPNRTLSTISRATAAFMTHDHLRSMELAPQLLALLTNCPVIQFKQICDLNGIPSVEGGLAVVDELQSIAYCVQGCWVLKSHIYHTSQIELARDWLLTSFARSRTVSRRQFTERSRLSIETTEVLLEEFAVRCGTRCGSVAWPCIFLTRFLCFHPFMCVTRSRCHSTTAMQPKTFGSSKCPRTRSSCSCFPRWSHSRTRYWRSSSSTSPSSSNSCAPLSAALLATTMRRLCAFV